MRDRDGLRNMEKFLCLQEERERERAQLKEGEQRGKYEWNLTEARPQQPQVSLGEKKGFKLEKLITACRMTEKYIFCKTAVTRAKE